MLRDIVFWFDNRAKYIDPDVSRLVGYKHTILKWYKMFFMQQEISIVQYLIENDISIALYA